MTIRRSICLRGAWEYRSITADGPFFKMALGAQSKTVTIQELELVQAATSRWAIGITTAPRQEPTLHTCLTSLLAAGWDQVRVFAEPGVERPDGFPTLLWSCRDEPLGAFPNWLLGLVELVLREPHADAYFMCQDDAVMAAGLRYYLERRLWPAPKVGVVSVYCPSHYARNQPSGFHIEDRGWDSWGALAYIFPNPSARSIVSDPLVIGHRHHGPAAGLRNIDSVVGRWCRQQKLPYYVHVPSLAQHIGRTSTIFPGASNRGRRRAADFLDDVDQHASGRGA